MIQSKNLHTTLGLNNANTVFKMCCTYLNKKNKRDYHDWEKIPMTSYVIQGKTGTHLNSCYSIFANE